MQGYRTSVNPSVVTRHALAKSAAADAQILVQRRVQFFCIASYDWSQALLLTWKLAFSRELFN
jgi:hypothetical protein